MMLLTINVSKKKTFIEQKTTKLSNIISILYLYMFLNKSV